MTESGSLRPEFPEASRKEIQSALFAQLILQLSNMAMMMMGKVPDPRGGQTLRDLEAAQLFIDQLEALEIKTKGNLTKEEEGLLKQTLMALRLAFVEAVESPVPTGKTGPSAPDPRARESSTEPVGSKSQPTTESSSSSDESSAKRFSKRYPG